MISFPNAKLNIGLNVIERREDGYHNIESIFYPVNWRDVIEVIPTEGKGTINLSLSGIPVPGTLEGNLCAKVYHLLNKEYTLPSVNFYLLKQIPMGAGLGGGSADAAFFLNLLNELFHLHIGKEELKQFASQIGSDCTFFIENKPSVVTGTGNIIAPISLDLSSYFIAIIYPRVHIDTKNAYSLITPHKKSNSLSEAIRTPIDKWKETIVNDFEEPIFKAYPQLAEIKSFLYKQHALYASMTGSGSALYGIFAQKPHLDNLPSSYQTWISSPDEKYI